MSERENPDISREFCQQIRRDGGYMALSHLDGLLQKWKCPDCPSDGSRECRNHVKELISKILPSFHK